MATRIPRQLIAKRHALAHEREQLHARLSQIDEELRSLDYAIRVLNPSWKPPAMARRPTRPRRLPKGKLASTCLRLVRQKPGISTPELANLAVMECGLRLASKSERQDFASAVAMALRRYARSGVVEITGKNKSTGALHWRIRPAAERPSAA